MKERPQRWTREFLAVSNVFQALAAVLFWIAVARQGGWYFVSLAAMVFEGPCWCAGMIALAVDASNSRGERPGFLWVSAGLHLAAAAGGVVVFAAPLGF